VEVWDIGIRDFLIVGMCVVECPDLERCEDDAGSRRSTVSRPECPVLPKSLRPIHRVMSRLTSRRHGQRSRACLIEMMNDLGVDRRQARTVSQRDRFGAVTGRSSLCPAFAG